jgi:hypothetical protein
MATRFRLRFTFWLDLQKADEAAIAELIDGLKRSRTFASAIRDGIRLVCALRAGRTDVLFELFPWVRDGLQSAPAAATDQHLQAQIARLEALLIAQGSVPLPGVTMRKPQAEVSASTSKASAETVAQNFLRSMQGLASGLFD